MSTESRLMLRAETFRMHQLYCAFLQSLARDTLDITRPRWRANSLASAAWKISAPANRLMLYFFFTARQPHNSSAVPFQNMFHHSLSNSSISDLLYFHGTLPAIIPPCQLFFHNESMGDFDINPPNASCAQVCGDAFSLSILTLTIW